MLRNHHEGAFAVLAVVGLLLSCSNERPLEPVPASYRFYVAMKHPLTFREGYILSIDCDTDSIVDSLHLSGLPDSWGPVYASPSTPIIVIPDEVVHKVYDTRSRTFLASFESRITGAAFFPELGRTVISTGKLLVYEDTTYNLRAVIDERIGYGKRVGMTTRIIGQSESMSASFTVIDILTGAVIDSFKIDAPDGDNGLVMSDFQIAPDGTRIYASVWTTHHPPWLVGYDLLTRRALFWYPHVGSSGPASYHISPSGDEVWATWGANIIGEPWPTSVHILDAFSGALLDTVDLSPTKLGWPYYTTPTQVRFVPNLPKAYVSCGASFSGGQPVVVVNTEDRQIEKILFENSDRNPRQTAIGPGW